ncbi:MAG: hypothetical protein JWM84_2733 [Nocardioides sp.]|nr:hypothetical protein [Nocardioides sp.]
MAARTSLGRLLAAVALVAAAAGAGAAVPVHAASPAAACSSARGVTVVVDFNQLGGGSSAVCDADGGGKEASELFPDAGYQLSYASRMPGFVCRVRGVPTSDPCVNTSPGNAYWSLWWSDGKTGSWSYASLGADSLTIPDGGYVAFSWDQSDGTVSPSLDPAKHAAAPPPPPASSSGAGGSGNGNSNGGGQSSGGGTADGGGQGGGASTGPSASSSTAPSTAPSASTSAAPGKPGKPGKPAKSRKSRASQAPSASPSATTEAADGELTGTAPTAAEPQDDGLPAFVAPVLIGTLFGVAGIVFLLRRRSGPA